MRRGQNQVAALLVGLIGLVGLLYWATAPPREAAPRLGLAMLWNLPLHEVRAVSVEGAWRLHRPSGDDAWWITPEGGPAVPADPVAALEVADAVSEASAGADASGVDPAEVGLDAPERVEVVGMRPGASWTVEVGEELPRTGRTWVRTPEGEVVAVLGGLGSAIRQPVSALEDRALTRLDPIDRVTTPRREARWDGTSWQVRGMPSSAAEAWVQRWREARIEAWEDPPGEATAVWVVIEDGDGVTERLAVARHEGTLYVRPHTRWGQLAPEQSDLLTGSPSGGPSADAPGGGAAPGGG